MILKMKFWINLAIAVARVSEMRMKTMRRGRRTSPRTHIFSFYKYKERFMVAVHNIFTIERLCRVSFRLWTAFYI